MMGKAILWGIIGAFAGCWLGGLIAGAIGLTPALCIVIAGLGVGFAAFIGSYRNEGRPPKWLWRSKPNKNKAEK